MGNIICAMICALGFASEPPEMVDVSQKVLRLASSKSNKLGDFAPRILSEGDEASRRHTPLLFVESPWKPIGAFGLEVPEYSWAHVPGDPHNNDPFFYGRQVGLNRQWHVRYPALDTPRWRPFGQRGLALDVRLTGGYVQRFRVLTHERVVEVRFGITNNSGQPLKNVRCQLCLRSNAVKALAQRWPTSSKFLSRGELVTWDSLGQDLSWLDEFRSERPGQFKQSCFFLAPVDGYQPQNYPEKERARQDLMWFNRPIDVPAIAKADESGRAVIVYCPHGKNAFYNVLVPCFHADPHVKIISSGETRWTSSFLILFEGKLEPFFEQLATLHKTIAREDGYLDEQFARDVERPAKKDK